MAAQGLQSELIDLRRRDSRGDLGGYAAVVVASPVHAGKHAPEVIAFVKDHRSELARTRTAFVSVTLSQAGVQRSNATHDEHQKFAADVRRVNERFFARTGWLPARIENVALDRFVAAFSAEILADDKA
jgi:menaquinone-dependent protoporphyrinogen IX oxidase